MTTLYHYTNVIVAYKFSFDTLVGVNSKKCFLVIKSHENIEPLSFALPPVPISYFV